MTRPRGLQIATAILTLALLVPIQAVVPNRMLIAERFIDGGGWVQIAVLVAWAVFLVGRMAQPGASARWRLRAWTLFSVAFFGQLALGLAGVDRFLMTGALHVPVPAVIAAGPAYRGSGWFMPILFGATTLLVGPAWCSHLCYFGAWDGVAASRRKRAGAMPRWRRAAQVGMLVAVVGTAAALGGLGVAPEDAALAGVAFGLAGIGVMLGWSRRTGVMAHCTLWCPIGLLATTLGRLSPFRMRVRPGCTHCGACGALCRYDALRPTDLDAGRPGPSCTLCGDCVRPCRLGLVEYRLLGLSATASRDVFLVLVVALHAVFLGLAMI